MSLVEREEDAQAELTQRGDTRLPLRRVEEVQRRRFVRLPSSIAGFSGHFFCPSLGVYDYGGFHIEGLRILSEQNMRASVESSSVDSARCWMTWAIHWIENHTI